MLLHLCLKSISGNINFDLYYTFCKCIFRIYIYINFPVDLSKLSDVVKNDVVKKTVYDNDKVC